MGEEPGNCSSGCRFRFSSRRYDQRCIPFHRSKCTATSRVIVQHEVYEKFKQKLLAKTKEITVGEGLNEDTWMGPCASENQLQTVLSYIEKGGKN